MEKGAVHRRAVALPRLHQHLPVPAPDLRQPALAIAGTGLAGRDRLAAVGSSRPAARPPRPSEWPVGPEQLGQLVRGQRSGEEVALAAVAVAARAARPAGPRSRSPRRRRRSEPVGEARSPPRTIGRFASSPVEPGHERPVDLDRVERQVLEVRQRRVAGPEVVEDELDAELAAQPAQRRRSPASDSSIRTDSVISSSRHAGSRPVSPRIRATCSTRSGWANCRADRLTLMRSGRVVRERVAARRAPGGRPSRGPTARSPGSARSPRPAG